MHELLHELWATWMQAQMALVMIARVKSDVNNFALTKTVLSNVSSCPKANGSAFGIINIM
jgi:hypothetical protein